MKLYIARHGETISSLDNPERPLSDRGVEDTERLAAHCARAGLQIPHVVHTEKLRAKQTADIFAKYLQPHKVSETAIGFDHVDHIANLQELIPTWDDDTLLVAHLPFVSYAVSELVSGDVNKQLVRFPPTTIVCLEPQEDHHWIINWVLNPTMV